MVAGISMNNTFNFARSNSFSHSNKLSYERLLVDADRLFSVDWLIRRLFSEFQSMLPAEAVTDHHLFFYSLRQESERWFVWNMITSHQQSLGEVRAIHQAFPEKEQFFSQLKDERQSLIEDFSKLTISKCWDTLRDDDFTWRDFAHKLFDLNKMRPEDSVRFFMLIDYICVITDVLCGRSNLYYLDATDEDKALLQEYIANEKSAPDLGTISARAELKSFLKEPWFDKYSRDKKKYTAEWRENFIDALLDHEQYGKMIVDDWDFSARNRRDIIKGGIVGCLKLAGVFKDKLSNLGLARTILYPNLAQLPDDKESRKARHKKSNTLSNYIRQGIKQEYYYWVDDYVKKYD